MNIEAKKHVFLTEDIRIDEFDSENSYDRYSFAESKENFIEFVLEADNESTEDDRNTYNEMTMKKLKEEFPDEWDRWNDEATFDEVHEVPMMNALRYFPNFVSFEVEEAYKAVGACTLLYDPDKEAWAVGMTGGGMDLGPDLLATFINLEKGVPLELAQGITRNYSGNLDRQTHEENCDMLARAFLAYSTQMLDRAQELSPKIAENDAIRRHFKGLQKAITE